MAFVCHVVVTSVDRVIVCCVALFRITAVEIFLRICVIGCFAARRTELVSLAFVLGGPLSGGLFQFHEADGVDCYGV